MEVEWFFHHRWHELLPLYTLLPPLLSGRGPVLWRSATAVSAPLRRAVAALVLCAVLLFVRRQLEAAAAREARAAAVSAAHAELAAALQDELQEAQQHQAATEARLREMAAALKRLRDEPATTCAE